MVQKVQKKPEIKKKIELMDSKSSKINTTIKRKVPLKSELTIQFKELKEKYDSLKNENIQNIETIKRLEMKVRELEEKSSLKRKASPSVMVSIKETQTLSDLYLKCNECDFETPTDTVFNWRLSKVHGLSADIRFCRWWFWLWLWFIEM